ncbi:MAG: sterol desaturase family protein [Ancalomicrobiaceae bacterium]|nr:sterol desaturase family protein [Ancalomicrobiaceae bacterium]
MAVSRLRMMLRRELEAPQDLRRFGTGWISGTFAVLAGSVSLLLALANRYPDILLISELEVVRQHPAFQAAIYFVLIAAYALSILSLILRDNKTLGIFAMTLTLAASLLGSLPPRHVGSIGVSVGLDYFVLNTLFIGFLFVPFERMVPHRRDQSIFRTEWREDLFYYLVSSLLIQVLTYLTLAPSRVLTTTVDLSGVRALMAGLPWVVQLLLVMFLTDFTQYWVHRLFHQVPALWRFHAVHHSAVAMDWLAGARMHIIEVIVLRSLTATPMFVLGFEPSVVQAYILIVYLWSAFVHANVEVNLGWLEGWIVVPRFHHWHHGIEREAIDVNFAIHFPIIDRMFGTYHMPEDRWPEGYGIGGHPVPNGYIAQFLYPLRRG